MSGGHFSYGQDRILNIIGSIQELIDNNNKKNEYEEIYNFSDKILTKFTETIDILLKAYQMVNKIDYLVSGGQLPTTKVVGLQFQEWERLD